MKGQIYNSLLEAWVCGALHYGLDAVVTEKLEGKRQVSCIRDPSVRGHYLLAQGRFEEEQGYVGTLRAEPS